MSGDSLPQKKEYSEAGWGAHPPYSLRSLPPFFHSNTEGFIRENTVDMQANLPNETIKKVDCGLL